MSNSFIEIAPSNKAQMMALRAALLEHAAHMAKSMRSNENDSEELEQLLRDAKRSLVLVQQIKDDADSGNWFRLSMDDIELYIDALSYVCNDQVMYCNDMLSTLGPLSKYWR